MFKIIIIRPKFCVFVSRTDKRKYINLSESQNKSKNLDTQFFIKKLFLEP